MPKRAARQFLGRGYDRTRYNHAEPSSHFTTGQVINISNDNDIYTETSKDILTHSVGFSRNDALEKINTTYALTLKANMYTQAVTVAIGGNVENLAINAAQENQLVCSFIRYQETYCRLDNLSAIPVKSKTGGDALVRSGLFYVGYQVNMFIQTATQQEQVDHTREGQVQATFSQATFTLTGESLASSLQNRRVLGVRVQAIGIGGYTVPTIVSDALNTDILASAMQQLRDIDAHFLMSVPRLEQRGIIINPQKDLMEYNRLLNPITAPINTKKRIVISADKGAIREDLNILAEIIAKEYETTVSPGRTFQEDTGIALGNFFRQMKNFLRETTHVFNNLLKSHASVARQVCVNSVGHKE